MLESREAFVGISNSISDSAGVETRTYFPHHIENPDIPYEVIIVSIPPGHTESFRSHETIEETIIALKGQVNIFTTKDGNTKKDVLSERGIYDEDQESIIGISVIDDGTVTLHIRSNDTRDIRLFKLDISKGFNSGSTIHTLQNYSEESAEVAVVKRVNPDILRRYPEIFRTDKKMF